ncbi:MAG: deoxyribose-phosphate aldolase [Virgibacillus proomii]|jgi:deoxyribose-phosphate aldolase
MSNYAVEEVARRIQHTNVNPDVTREDIKWLCEDCLEYGFDGVMLQPCWIEEAKKHLAGSNVKICTALGYPMGGATTRAKVLEMEEVIALGAEQVDFMANIGFLKSGMHQEYHDEITSIVQAAGGKVTKIMLEFGMLTEEEKVKAAELAIRAGVTYLKNSSGWGKGGHATIEDIKLLKRIANGKVEVKASGGIRDMKKATEILDAGASLIGTSVGAKIVSGSGEALSDY